MGNSKRKAAEDAAFLAAGSVGGLRTGLGIETPRDVAKRSDLFIGVGVICRQLKGSVTSWWRSPAHNESVGGAASSLHVRGLACDVVYDERPPLSRVTELAATFGLRVVREQDHDHIEARQV